MQVSIKWLKDYIDFTETPEELAEKLTMAGVPVENITTLGQNVDNVVSGKILKIDKHPNADRLSVCQIDVGKEILTIVTGATNVKENDIVPVALVGAKLPGGIKITKSKLRGVESSGMLCSVEELDLDKKMLEPEVCEGIFLLPPETELGVDVKTILGLDDVILEFELTANRADCFSVMGLVREIAVLTGKEFKKPEISVSESGKNATDLIKIEIADTSVCKRFAARVFENIKIEASPNWMKQRLEAAGIRSINNIVDITNFVMLELGQPLHAYDYDTIKGKTLIATKANPNEKITTLDDVERNLTEEMIVIADISGPVGVAGIMGGLATEVTVNTKTIVLEAATFQGVSVRRTSRAFGLRSEASGRFERGVDIVNIDKVLDRAAHLIQQLNAGVPCSGVIDVYPEPIGVTEISVTTAEINDYLGSNITENEIVNILEKLEFKVKVDQTLLITVPSWRFDVTCKADITEEIARIYGFNNIKSTLPYGNMFRGTQTKHQNFIDKVKNILVGTGLSEIISFSFTHQNTFDKLNLSLDSQLRRAVPILNPITDEFPLLRTTVVSSILENIAKNLDRRNDNIQIFEIGSVFYPEEIPLTKLPYEQFMLAGAITGRRNQLSWSQGKDNVDFYDLKGITEVLFSKLGIVDYIVEAGEHYAMHPGKTANFTKNNNCLAVIGEVHPEILEKFGISRKTYIFDIDLKLLEEASQEICQYQSLPKYPASSRDLAITINDEVEAGAVEATIIDNGGALLKEVKLFDVYKGEQVSAGQKSLAFALSFQSAEKTLTDIEIDEAYENIVKSLEKTFAAKLRS